MHASPEDQIIILDKRYSPVHWEGDLLSGAKNTHIATLVERRSRYLVLVKVEGKDTDNVVSALVREVSALQAGRMEMLTWDRGTKLAQYKRFTAATWQCFAIFRSILYFSTDDLTNI